MLITGHQKICFSLRGIVVVLLCAAYAKLSSATLEHFICFSFIIWPKRNTIRLGYNVSSNGLVNMLKGLTVIFNSLYN